MYSLITKKAAPQMFLVARAQRAFAINAQVDTATTKGVRSSDERVKEQTNFKANSDSKLDVMSEKRIGYKNEFSARPKRGDVTKAFDMNFETQHIGNFASGDEGAKLFHNT